MSQEMMVTSDSLKKTLAMLPKSLTAVWEDLADLSKNYLYTIELLHNTCQFYFGEQRRGKTATDCMSSLTHWQ